MVSHNFKTNKVGPKRRSLSQGCAWEQNREHNSWKLETKRFGKGWKMVKVWDRSRKQRSNFNCGQLVDVSCRPLHLSDLSSRFEVLTQWCIKRQCWRWVWQRSGSTRGSWGLWTWNLATLTGVGGIGESRIGSHQQSHFLQDFVGFVHLEPYPSPIISLWCFTFGWFGLSRNWGLIWGYGELVSEPGHWNWFWEPCQENVNYTDNIFQNSFHSWIFMNIH